MTTSDSTGPEPTLPLSVAQRIDTICDRFEDALKTWKKAASKTAQRPRIEDCCANIDRGAESALFRDLLVLELLEKLNIRTEDRYGLRESRQLPLKSALACGPPHFNPA